MYWLVVLGVKLWMGNFSGWYLMFRYVLGLERMGI